LTKQNNPYDWLLWLFFLGILLFLYTYSTSNRIFVGKIVIHPKSFSLILLACFLPMFLHNFILGLITFFLIEFVALFFLNLEKGFEIKYSDKFLTFWYMFSRVPFSLIRTLIGCPLYRFFFSHSDLPPLT